MTPLLLLAAAALALPLAAQSFEVTPDVWEAVAASGTAEYAEQSPAPVVSPAPVPNITASFASQGAAALQAVTGKRVKGVGLESVIVCAASPAKVSAGRVYQTAIEHGVSPIDPTIATALVTRTVDFSIFNLLPDFISDGASGAAFLGASKVISMSNPWIAGLIGGGAISSIVTKRLKGFAPDPTPLFKSLLDPAATLTFAEAGCIHAMMVIRYKGAKNEVDGTFGVQ